MLYLFVFKSIFNNKSSAIFDHVQCYKSCLIRHDPAKFRLQCNLKMLQLETLPHPSVLKINRSQTYNFQESKSEESNNQSRSIVWSPPASGVSSFQLEQISCSSALQISYHLKVLCQHSCGSHTIKIQIPRSKHIR